MFISGGVVSGDWDKKAGSALGGGDFGEAGSRC